MDATVDNDMSRSTCEDMPQSDFVFLREAVSKLGGGWSVVEVVDAMPDDDSRVVTFADIDPDERNARRHTSYQILKYANGNYEICAFRDDVPIDHPDASVELDGASTIQGAFASVARHLYDPLARPRLDKLHVGFRLDGGDGYFCDVSKTDHGWSAKKLYNQPELLVTEAPSMEAAIEGLARLMRPDWGAPDSLACVLIFMGRNDLDEPSTPGSEPLHARRVAGGWEGSAGGDLTSYGLSKATIEEAWLDAWGTRSASMAA
jgi:hypothetical protein